ncbi:MAG: filamentous hemagglutinin N-terminal domain-containing protein [Microcystaceae cyanobacterium]
MTVLYRLTIASSVLYSVLCSQSALTQIAPDQTLGGESSIVTPVGANFDRIDGGAVRGSNLFHSFSQFNIPEGHSAYFANPALIQTIFSRVTGNNPSHIMGRLGVLGDANLVFMNPHGVIFGQNASLDIAGSFVVTTAESIRFPDGSQFSAVNPQGVPLLTIDVPVPVGIVFEGDPTGKIYNAGDLDVGGNLSVIGGEILNTGSLTALNGTIELNTVDLSGSNLVTGDIVITGSSEQVSLLGNNANITAGNNLVIQDAKIGTIEYLNLTAQDTVVIRDSVFSPVQIVAGQDLTVQGNKGVDIFALNNAQSGLVSGGDMILKSPDAVGGDAHFWSGGSFKIEKLNGELGDLNSPYDPIIRSQGDVEFSEYQGASLHILSGGSVNINTIVITGADTIGDSINPTATPELANVTLSDGTDIVINGNAQPTLDIRAGMNPEKIGTPLGTIGFNGAFLNNSFLQTFPPNNNPNVSNSGIAIGKISIFSSDGMIFLTNQYEPNLELSGGEINLTWTGLAINGRGGFGSIGSKGSDVILDARRGINLVGTIDVSDASGFLNVGGNVKFLANNDITISNGATIQSVGLSGGNITLKSQSGDIIIDDGIVISITTGFEEGKGGDIDIAAQSVVLSNFGRVANLTFGNRGGGDITVKANNTINVINEGGKSQAPNNILALATGFAATTSGEGIGGNIIITANKFNITNNSNPQEEQGAGVSTINSENSIGRSGNIFIKVEDKISITGNNSEPFEPNLDEDIASQLISIPTGISSATNGTGNAGTLTIETGSLEVKNNAAITSGTVSRATGEGGELIIKARESIRLRGIAGIASGTNSGGNGGNLQINPDVNLPTSKITLEDGAVIFTGTIGSGFAGELIINTSELEMSGGSQISAETNGEGRGGILDIRATDSIRLSGTTINGIPTGISTSAKENSINSAGILTITTPNLSVQDQAVISSRTSSIGNGGDIIIIAPETIALKTEGSITAQTSDSGNAGNITLNTPQLTLDDKANISAATTGEGNPGNILIKNGESQSNQVILTNKSTISTEINAEGNKDNALPANVTIDSDNLFLDSSAITTSTSANRSAGDINLPVNNIRLDNATITAITQGSGDGGNISLPNSGSLNLANGSEITALTQGEGNAGNINLNTSESIFVDNGSSLNVETQAGGQAGIIEVNTPILTVGENAQLSATATSSSTAKKAGNIALNADTLNISGELGIFAETQSIADAGSLSIQPYQTNPNLNIQFTDNGFISARTTNIGDGGSITITAPETIDISGFGSITAETSGSGDAGNININSQTLNIADGTNITTSTDSSGNAGLITINANQALFLTNQSKITSEVREGAQGSSQGIILNTPSLTLNNSADISASTQGIGNAGNIDIFQADTVTIDNESSLNVQTDSSGMAGNINLTTNTLTIGKDSELSARSTIDATGRAGNVLINVDFLNLTGELGIFTETDGMADAGNLNINPNNNPNLAITFFDEGQISASTSSVGNGGNINLNAPQTLNLQGNGTIKVETTGTGRAGNINFNSQQLNISEGVTISALTSGAGEAGSIILSIPEAIMIDSGTTFTVETDGAKDAGNIQFSANQITLGENTELTARSTANATGKAGNIELNTNQLTLFGNQGIFAETLGDGDAGSIFIQSLDDNLPLNISFFNKGNISASTSGNGDGGNIEITGNDIINLTGDGNLQVETEGNGEAGSIFIISEEQLNLSGGINSEINISASTSGSGNAGNLNLNANQITLSQTQINAFTNSTGNPGNIVLSDGQNNAQSVTLNNNSVISTEIQSQGQADSPSNIEIRTDNLTINNSEITASTEGKGDAGSITVPNAININLNQSEITASTSGEGDTGEIELSAANTLQLNNNSIISSSVEQGAEGNSQQITLNTPNLALTNSTIQAETEGIGNAGSIDTLNTEFITLDNSTISTAITADGQASQPSNITLNTKQ